MTRWLLIAGLVLSGGFALADNQTDTGTQNLQDTQRSNKLDTQRNTEGQAQMGTKILPTGAKLVGSASAAEVRTFPEMSKTKGMTAEETVGARAIDRVYETNKPYKQTVAHFDKMVKSGQAEQMERTVTKTATGWSLKMPDGTVQNVVVRNTQPTTIETVQATGAVEEEGMKHKSVPSPGTQGGTMDQDQNQMPNGNQMQNQVPSQQPSNNAMPK